MNNTNEAVDLYRQKQKHLHRPDEGEIGDCYRTAIACVLGVPRDSVPHFVEICGWDNGVGCHAATLDWLKREHGMTMVRFPIWHFGEGYEQARNQITDWNPTAGRYLFSGQSRNGTFHCVVAHGRAIEWDPAIDDSGIVAPGPEGWYWAEFIVGVAA